MVRAREERLGEGDWEVEGAVDHGSENRSAAGFVDAESAGRPSYSSCGLSG